MASAAVRLSAAALLCIVTILSLTVRLGKCQDGRVLFTTTRIDICSYEDDKNPMYFKNPNIHHWKSRLGTDVDLVVTRTIEEPANLYFFLRECDGVDCFPMMDWRYELCSALENRKIPDDAGGFAKIDDIVPMLVSVNLTCPIEEGTYKIRRFPNFYYEPVDEDSRDETYALATTLLDEKYDVLFCTQKEETARILGPEDN